MYEIKKGSTDVTIYLRLRDSATGLAKTGLAYNSAGAACYYTRPLAAAVAITLATQTVTGAHSDGGFVEVDAANAKGLYRLDLPDAALASGVDSVVVSIEFDGIIEESILILLVDNKVKDVYDKVAHATYGLDKLVRSATPANALQIEADGMAHADVKEWKGGTAPSFPANFADLAITATTGLVDITQAAADKAWSTTTRTLTSFGSLIADIWHHLLTGITTAGSIGKLIKDNLDATVSSRSSHDDPDPGGLIDAAISSRASQTSLDTVDSNVDQLLLDLDVLIGDNVRVRAYTASGAVAGRNVADGAVSHLEVEVKADAAADFSAPIDTYFMVFAYATSGDSDPDRRTKSETAPVDGTFNTNAWI